MDGFNQILLDVHPDFVDFDAVDRTAGLACKTNAAVKVVHVVEDYPEDMSEWWNVRNPLKLGNKILRERQGFVNSTAERVRAAGVDRVESTLRWGREFLEITREVLRNHQELVVTGIRHLPLFPGTRMGCPCVMGLCRYTPSAIWVTCSRLGERAKRARGVLASLGGANDQVKCEGLNAKILKTAAYLAEAEGSELHIVHAVSPHGGEGLNGHKLEPNPAEYLREFRGEIQEACNAPLGDIGLSLTEDRIHLAYGSPTEVIPEVAKEQGLDPIVMGTHARDGISGLLVGNTAERVMTQVDCGVMVVKPDDFISLVAREEGMYAQERRRDQLSNLNDPEDSWSHATLEF